MKSRNAGTGVFAYQYQKSDVLFRQEFCSVPTPLEAERIATALGDTGTNNSFSGSDTARVEANNPLAAHAMHLVQNIGNLVR